MKRGIAALLAVMLLCVSAAAESDKAAENVGTAAESDKAPETPFTDVSPADYFAPAVEWAVERGVTNGTSATKFSPSAPCTRAQVVTFLWRARGCPESGATNAFSDVRKTAYYYQPVLWAVEHSITNGVTEKFFSPHLGCSRAQILTMLWRDAGKPAASGEGEIASANKSHWAADALSWAEENGLLEENKAAFRPNDICPRADVMYYLYQSGGRPEDPKGEADLYNASILYQAANQDDFAGAVSDLIREYETKVSVSVQNGEYASGRLIVKASAIPSLEEYHAVRLIRDTEGHYVIQFTTDADAERCANALKALPEVEYAEADGIVTANAGGAGGDSIGGVGGAGVDSVGGAGGAGLDSIGGA